MTGAKSTLPKMLIPISSPEVSELSDREESIITSAFLGHLSALILHAHLVRLPFSWLALLFGQGIVTRLLLGVCLV
jgi:hypothetical protein